MVDPAIIGGAATVAAVAIAAAYSYFSGDDSEVNLDSDEEAEFTFEGNDQSETKADDTTVEAEEPQTFQAAPDDVRDIASALDEIKGIGPTRADDLKKAGFHTASDLYFASDAELKEVSGIGDLTVSQIREDIGSVEGNQSGESDEEADATSQDSEDQDSTSEQSDSNEQNQSESADTEESESDQSGSDSGETTDSTGNASE